jgi:UDP-N-acetylglucosamine 2-epimerase (non-hydrolysing)
MTDSGGVQEETTVLGIPCLTLRENTERPVTISEGTNQLVKPARDAIIDKALEVLHEPPRPGRIPEFWDGRAAERIVRVLLGEAVAPEREATRRGPAGLSEGPDRRTP